MRRAASSRRPRAAVTSGAAGPALAPAGAGGAFSAAPQAPAPAVAELLERGFRAAAAKAVADTHAAGLPVAGLDAQGRPVWRHPDGTLEPMADPTRIPARP